MKQTIKRSPGWFNYVFIHGVYFVSTLVLSLSVDGVSDNMKMDQGAIFVATALAAFVGHYLWGS